MNTTQKYTLKASSLLPSETQQFVFLKNLFVFMYI